MTSIGKLRHKVTIQKKVIGDNASATGKGERTWIDDWQDVPAEVKSIFGRELEQARQLVPNATAKVTIRHREGITTKHRFVLNDRIFYIGYIDNMDQRNYWLACTCSEDL